MLLKHSDMQFRFSICILPVWVRFSFSQIHIEKSSCALGSIVIMWKVNNICFYGYRKRPLVSLDLSVLDGLPFCLTTIATYHHYTDLLFVIIASTGAWESRFTWVAVAINFISTNRNQRLFGKGTSAHTVLVIPSTLNVHLRYFQQRAMVRYSLSFWKV